MGKFYNLSKTINQKGQSVVEYIMLLLVVISLAQVISKNRYFKEIFGSDSSLFAGLRTYQEITYQMGSLAPSNAVNYSSKQGHALYYSGTAGAHFYFPKESTP